MHVLFEEIERMEGNQDSELKTAKLEGENFSGRYVANEANSAWIRKLPQSTAPR